ncbi:MAG: FGGY-family carbohydrate kinase [Christensenellales bacterium]
MKHIIAIDAGTQSLRAVVFDAKGSVLFSAAHDYAPAFYPGNRAEQDPADWEYALRGTLFRAGAFLSQHGLKADCVAVTSQRASVIPVDNGGAPLHPALMWQDKRATRQCEYIAGVIPPGELYRQCGLRLDPYFSLPKMLYLKQERPDVWKKTHKLLGVQDYVNFLLTGNYVTDLSQACRTMLMDINAFDWNLPLLDKLELKQELLCDLCPPGGVSGRLTEDFAQASGLPSGLPVLLCGGDQQCAALALGLFSPGSATVNTGTGSFVLGYVDKPVFDARQRILCSAAAVPGRWIVEAGIYASGATYNWCRKNFFPDSESFDEIDAEVENTPVGSGGVFVLPHFQGSAAPNWNPLAKGMFFNLTLGTTRGEMCRAVLEGIAMEIADNIALIEENAGAIDRVFLAGGLTKFPAYCQILSDALCKRAERRENSEASLLGCLMSAGVTLGHFEDYETACAAVIQSDKREFTPNKENAALYGRIREVKRALYGALDAAKIYELVK